jgi:hypothetical protein
VHFDLGAQHSPTGFCSSAYGLRLGNLLSPLLFAIVIKALGKMIYATMSGSLLAGFFVGTRDVGGY